MIPEPDVKYDRKMVEGMQHGRFTISISGPGEIWGHPERPQRLAGSIHDIVRELSERGIGLGCLRLVVVTTDFENAIAEWQQQLGELTGISSPHEGQVAGKMLIWGDGGHESTYAIVFIRDWIGFALTENDPESGQIAKSTVAHELAHICDSQLRLRDIGLEGPVTGNDWDGLCRGIAKTLWGEFFAEIFASRYHSDDDIRRYASYGVSLIQHADQSIRHGIVSYRQHGDMSLLWPMAVSKLEVALNQLGRVLGEHPLTEPISGPTLTAFVASIRAVSPDWANVVNKARQELTALLDKWASRSAWHSDDFDGLAKVVAAGFHATGLFPQYTEQGLWVGFTKP